MVAVTITISIYLALIESTHLQPSAFVLSLVVHESNSEGGLYVDMLLVTMLHMLIRIIFFIASKQDRSKPLFTPDMNLTEAELHVSISWLWVLFLGKDLHVSKSSCWLFSWSKEGRTSLQCSPRNWWGWPEQLKVHDRNLFDAQIYPLNAAVEFGPKSWESMRMFLFLICQKSPVGILGPWSHWVLGSA